MSAQIEYLGFTSQAATRQYTLRVRLGAGEPHDVRLAIPNEVFLARRLRYQDAPEICFLIVQREIVACNGGLPSPELTVTDADLASYREAHAPKPSQRRPKPA
jgi:hypothetical protein